MTHQEIATHFGYSEFSPEVKQLFKKLEIPLQQPTMSVCWRTYESQKWGLDLVFRAKNNFFSDYGPFKLAYTDSYDEAFLEEINFGNQHGSTNYPFSLPFNLAFSDLPEVVKEKTGIKASKLSDASYGSYFVFNTEDFHFVIGFDKNSKLIWISVRLLELNFKKKRELTKTLKQQNKHINLLNVKQLTELKSQSPVKNWHKRMKEGDNIFNERIIEDTDTTLINFIDNLIDATGKKKANTIYAAINKVVKSLNNINEKNKSFIDTMEREELVDYIHKAIQLTGFKIEKGMDLTEEWREW